MKPAKKHHATDNQESIVALCTPRGSGAIAVIRISGYDAINVVDALSKLSSGKKLTMLPTHTIHHGYVVEGDKRVDEVLFFLMHGPKTFTGQDTVEISCHNNPFIIESKIEDMDLKLHKTINKLNGKVFESKHDAKSKANNLQKQYRFHKIKYTVTPSYQGVENGESLVLTGHKLELSSKKNYYKIFKAKNRKGKFILATNFMDTVKSSSKTIFEAYNRRNSNIEAQFRMLKGSPFLSKGLYFKRVDRIQGLMTVMALTLFVNNVGQHWLRQGLTSHKQTVPNQRGKPTKTPTLSWAFELLKNINIVTVKIKDTIYRKLTGITDAGTTIINIFGHHAKEIYGFT